MTLASPLWMWHGRTWVLKLRVCTGGLVSTFSSLASPVFQRSCPVYALPALSGQINRPPTSPLCSSSIASKQAPAVSFSGLAVQGWLVTRCLSDSSASRWAMKRSKSRRSFKNAQLLITLSWIWAHTALAAICSSRAGEVSVDDFAIREHSQHICGRKVNKGTATIRSLWSRLCLRIKIFTTFFSWHRENTSTQQHSEYGRMRHCFRR